MADSNITKILLIVAAIVLTGLIISYAIGLITGLTESAAISPIVKEIITVGQTAKINMQLLNTSIDSITVTGLQLLHKDTEYDLNSALILNSTVPAHSDFGISGVLKDVNDSKIPVIAGDEVLITVTYLNSDGGVKQPHFKIKVS